MLFGISTDNNNRVDHIIKSMIPYAKNSRMHACMPPSYLEKGPFAKRYPRSVTSRTMRAPPLTHPPFRVLREKRRAERPITHISEEISHELQDIMEPNKGRVLALILHEFFKEQGFITKTNYSIQIEIGPNITKYRADLALFNSSGNLQAIVETVNNLTLKGAKDLSLYLLQIKQKFRMVELFVVFIRGTRNALQFLKSIVDGLYSVNEVQILLEQFQRRWKENRIS